MVRLVLFAFVVAASHKKHKTTKHAAAAPEAVVVDLTGWIKTHPEAAQSLGEWVQANPTAARALFTYDDRNAKTPHDTPALLAWTLKVEHGEAAEFVAQHPDWKEFATLVEVEALGIDRFIRWCRDHPKAAGELEATPAPLAWLGKNAYQEQLKTVPPATP